MQRGRTLVWRSWILSGNYHTSKLSFSLVTDGYEKLFCFVFSLELRLGCGVWQTTPWSPAVTWRRPFAASLSAPMDHSWRWAWRTDLSSFFESGTYWYGKGDSGFFFVKINSPGHKVCQDLRKNAFTIFIGSLSIHIPLSITPKSKHSENPTFFGNLFSSTAWPSELMWACSQSINLLEGIIMYHDLLQKY